MTLDTGAMYVGRGTGAGPSGMGGPSLSQLAPPNVTRSMPVPGKGGPGDFGDGGSVMSIAIGQVFQLPRGQGRLRIGEMVSPFVR